MDSENLPFANVSGALVMFRFHLEEIILLGSYAFGIFISRDKKWDEFRNC